MESLPAVKNPQIRPQVELVFETARPERAIDLPLRESDSLVLLWYRVVRSWAI